jgi:SAM-dependent methyltransferase
MAHSIPQVPPRMPWQERARTLLKRTLIPPTLVLRGKCISRYLSSESQPKLHVACGSNLLSGWLNTDLAVLNRGNTVYLDARKDLPFANDTFCYIFNEHFINCLTLDQGVHFFAECYRVLRPRGVLRTATSGWPLLVDLYRADHTLARRYVEWANKEFLHTSSNLPCLTINNYVYGFNLRFIYDPSCLAWALSQAGFLEIAAANVGESGHKALRGIERHGTVVPDEFNQFETFVLEATKK